MTIETLKRIGKKLGMLISIEKTQGKISLPIKQA
jgi:hypothetical protein